MSDVAIELGDVSRPPGAETGEEDLAQIDAMLNKESGLKGICGLNDMRDIHAAAAAGDERARLAFEDINEWNRKTRLNTAYIDEEQDPVMESDLLANAGINEAIVKEFVGLFVHSFGPDFRRFVSERNRAR